MRGSVLCGTELVSAVDRPETPLKRILDEEGRRQDWLARQLNVDESAVSRWVRGVHVPSEPNRRAIAEALGRNVDDVFPPEPIAA